MKIKKNSQSLIQRTIACIKKRFARPPPNIHMPADSSALSSLGGGHAAFLRPSFSDWVRSIEYQSSIYVPNNQLTIAVQNLKPNLLVDIGANVGLSSLSLLNSFPSVSEVVGIEAERENFEVLKLNYEYWSKQSDFTKKKSIKFIPIYAIASNICVVDGANISVTRLSGGISASGTFKFVNLPQGSKLQDCSESDQPDLKLEFSDHIISISEIFNSHLVNNSSVVAVVKIDIEGGEEHLFLEASDWLNHTAFLTAEIHDSMGAPYSSRALLEKLVSYDFAIVPEVNVLHCYNRKLLNL